MKIKSILFCVLFFINIQFGLSGNGGINYKPIQTNSFMGTILTGMSIGVGGGLSISYGDLAPYKMFPSTKFWKTHIQSGYSIYIEREIKYGLGARFQFQSANLKGERITDIKKIGPLIAFKTNYNVYALQIKYDLTEALFKPNEYRRFVIDGLIGGGLLSFRSYTYYKDRNAWVYKSYGYVEGQNLSGKSTLAGKDNNQLIFVLPITARVRYRLNYKTDIFMEATLNNTFTDRLDAYDREEFTANDKAGYYGVGLTFNFGREEADLLIKEKTKKNGESSFSEIDDVEVAKRKGIIRKIFGRRESQQDLEMRMKLFDTQLKMLELEYLNEK